MPGKVAKNRGFTLVELMTTLVVVVTMLSLGVPAISGLRDNAELATMNNRLVTALTLARGEAIDTGDLIRVCPNNSNCLDNEEWDPVWESGWIVWGDKDGDGVYDSGSETARIFGSLPTGWTLRSDATGAAAADGPMAFRSDGVMGQVAGAGFKALSGATFILCDSDNKFRRGVVVTAVGSVRKPRNIDGVLEDHEENALNDGRCP